MNPVWRLLFLLVTLCLCSLLLAHEKPNVDLKTTSVMEGSCVTIKCTYDTDSSNEMYLLWFKDPVYDSNEKQFNGTIVYSNKPDRPQASEYSNRVQYQGNANSKPGLCTLRINDLQIHDGGNYSFRTIQTSGTLKFISDYVNLTIKDNPCKIHIEPLEKRTVKEGDTVSIQCSTSELCSDYPEWLDVIPEMVSNVTNTGSGKKITQLNLNLIWEDHGRKFLCRPARSTDDCQTRNITLTVEHAPRQTELLANSHNVKEGDHITLTCSTKAYPNASFTWFKNNNLIETSSSNKYYTLNDIKPEHSGEYRCEARNLLGKNSSSIVKISVKYAPKDVRVKAEPSKVKVGDTLELTCLVQDSNPAALYSWYRNNIHLNEQKRTLLITGLKQSHSGWYHCQATNEIGSTNATSTEISVRYAPENTSIQGEHKIKLRSTLNLHCSTNANPCPNNYSWSYKSEDTQRYIVHSQMAQTYQIKNVTIKNAGWYICSAKNVIGTGSKSPEFKVDVLYPPSKPDLIMIQTIRENEMLSIKCTVKSYPMASMTLSRTSRTNTEDVVFTKKESNTLSFSHNVSESHAGEYTCTAENTEGKSYTKQRLKVLYVPKDVQVLLHSGQDLKEKTNLTLTCKAHSEPAVSKYTWMKSSGKENQRKSEELGSAQNLNLYFLTSSNSGHYFCTARNDLGTNTSASVEIRVKYRPKITIIYNLTSLNKWDGKAPVNLTCNADCYPAATGYQWFRKDQEDQTSDPVSSDRTYIVQPQNAATYYCTARNEIGDSISDAVKLFVNGLQIMQIILSVVISIFLFCILIGVILIVHRIILKKRSSDSQSFFFPFITDRFSTVSSLLLLGPQNNTSEHLVMEGEMEPYSHRHNQTASTTQPNTLANRDNLADRPVPNILGDYDVVKSPQAIQETSAMSTMNYANLQNKDNNNPGVNSSDDCTVYAVVSKNNQNTKVVQKDNDDYENVSSVCARKPDFSNINWDSDSSEEEEEVNYSKVTFTVTQQHKPRFTDDGDDSSSDEKERTEYSQIIIR
ncbi:B-cell receptor CD22 [Salminus brasiliensis]|uniref:B-cell receptor CD22 n=1 Tax=Salminus brasiliensis TaxID=930266 RepID=UPI003B83A1F2